MPTGWLLRRAAAIAWPARSLNSARFGRPVSRSCSAMCSFSALLIRSRRVTDQLIALRAIQSRIKPSMISPVIARFDDANECAIGAYGR